MYSLYFIVFAVDVIRNRKVKRNFLLYGILMFACIAGELYQEVFGRSYVNHIQDISVKYDMKTKYEKNYGDRDGYVNVNGKIEVMEDVTNYIKQSICDIMT